MDTPHDEELHVAPRFRVVRRRLRLADGSELVRETVQHPGAVVILPLLPDGQVCLIRNQRIAVCQTLIELPAGTLEPDEDPAVTAARELTEETGYRAERIEKLGAWLMSPGILNERMHVFVATGLTPGPTALEAGEQIEPLEVSWSQALAMVQSGEIVDAKTVAAILFFDRFGQPPTNA
jgi:ADP-ribose pyrophosphatase